jgi:hypothetical protein
VCAAAHGGRLLLRRHLVLRCQRHCRRYYCCPRCRQRCLLLAPQHRLMQGGQQQLLLQLQLSLPCRLLPRLAVLRCLCVPCRRAQMAATCGGVCSLQIAASPTREDIEAPRCNCMVSGNYKPVRC